MVRGSAEEPVSSAYRVGVKYCGGCQLRYDRAAALRAIQRGCGSGISFAPVQEGQGYHFLLILNGCQQQCVNPDALRNQSPSFSLCHWTPLKQAVQAILRAREAAERAGDGKSDNQNLEWE